MLGYRKFIAIVFFISVSLQGQNTIAKFKYEDAEKAFLAKQYNECLTLLDETEKLLGTPAPNILHLKILAQYELYKTNPLKSYEAIEALQKNTSYYLGNYDIAGLEEKYRDVYEVKENIKESPKNKSEFDEIILAINQKEAEKKEFLKSIVEGYINAIGGREKLLKVNSIQREILTPGSFIAGTSASIFKEKYIKPNVIIKEYYKGKNGTKLFYKYVKNETTYTYYDKKGTPKNKLLKDGAYLDIEYRLAFFPELYFFEEGYQLEYEETNIALHKLIVTYPSGEVENRFYDKQNLLLRGVDFKITIPGNSYYPEYSLDYITFKDFKDIGGIKIPFKHIKTYTYNENKVPSNILLTPISSTTPNSGTTRTSKITTVYDKILINQIEPSPEFD